MAFQTLLVVEHGAPRITRNPHGGGTEMARYGIATVFTDSWADALAAAHAELWRHRVVAHGELPILNPGPIVDSAEDLQPPMSFRCPRCSFRVVAFENSSGLLYEESEKFMVVYSADGDRSVRAGVTAAALDFRAAVREMVRIYEEHIRTHGAALEEAESPGERAHLYTRYRCPRCTFTVEVVPAAELEAVG